MTKQDFFNRFESELSRCGVSDKREIIADFEQHFSDSMAEGLSEAEICARLGDASEIAKHYAEAEIFPAVAVLNEGGETEPGSVGTTPYESSGIKIDVGKFFKKKEENVEPLSQEENINNYNYGYSAPPPPKYKQHADYTAYENSGIKVGGGNFNVGNLVVVLCMDIFVFSWAIPSLFAIAVALLCIPFSFIIAGITVMFGGAFLGFPWFFNFGFDIYNYISGPAVVFAGIMVAGLGGLFGLAGIGLVRCFIKVIKAIIDWHGTMLTGKPVFNNNNKVNEGRFNT